MEDKERNENRDRIMSKIRYTESAVLKKFLNGTKEAIISKLSSLGYEPDDHMTLVHSFIQNNEQVAIEILQGDIVTINELYSPIFDVINDYNAERQIDILVWSKMVNHLWEALGVKTQKEYTVKDMSQFDQPELVDHFWKKFVEYSKRLSEELRDIVKVNEDIGEVSIDVG